MVRKWLYWKKITMLSFLTLSHQIKGENIDYLTATIIVYQNFKMYFWDEIKLLTITLKRSTHKKEKGKKKSIAISNLLILKYFKSFLEMKCSIEIRYSCLEI